MPIAPSPRNDRPVTEATSLSSTSSRPSAQTDQARSAKTTFRVPRAEADVEGAAGGLLRLEVGLLNDDLFALGRLPRRGKEERLKRVLGDTAAEPPVLRGGGNEQQSALAVGVIIKADGAGGQLDEEAAVLVVDGVTGHAQLADGDAGFCPARGCQPLRVGLPVEAGPAEVAGQLLQPGEGGACPPHADRGETEHLGQPRRQRLLESIGVGRKGTGFKDEHDSRGTGEEAVAGSAPTGAARGGLLDSIAGAAGLDNQELHQSPGGPCSFVAHLFSANAYRWPAVCRTPGLLWTKEPQPHRRQRARWATRHSEDGQPGPRRLHRLRSPQPRSRTHG